MASQSLAEQRDAHRGRTRTRPTNTRRLTPRLAPHSPSRRAHCTQHVYERNTCMNATRVCSVDRHCSGYNCRYTRECRPAVRRGGWPTVFPEQRPACSRGRTIGRRGVAEQVVAPLAGGQSLRVLAEGASRQARWARCGERSGETGCRAHRTRVTRTLKLKDPEADRAGSWRSGILPAASWSISVCSGERARATCRKNVVVD